MKGFWKDFLYDKWSSASVLSFNMLIISASHDFKEVWGEPVCWIFVFLMFFVLVAAFAPLVFKLVGGGPYEEDRRLRGYASICIISILLGSLPMLFEGQYWLYPVIAVVCSIMCVNVGRWAKLRDGEKERKMIHVNFKNNIK